MRALRGLPFVLLLAAACGSEDASLPPLTWTWVPIEGAVCGDGSATGVGIELGPGSTSDVLVFLMGGGACFDTLSCFTFQTATPGPYGPAELDRDLRVVSPGSVFDRTTPGNPYKDFTFVFVPYCTGDVHAGDAERDYLEAPRTWHHAGRPNLQKAFAHLATTLDTPNKVVVSGASAGGFGALLAFDLAKQAWPTAKGYLVDDSGPPLDAIPDATVLLWYESWNLGAGVNAICGDRALACEQNLSIVFQALAEKYPTDRFALLSSTQDATMRDFFGTVSISPPGLTPMPAQTFEDGVRALADFIEDDVEPGETHAFVVEGTSHTMLGAPVAFMSNGVELFEWLRRQVEDDPAWASAIPPP